MKLSGVELQGKRGVWRASPLKAGLPDVCCLPSLQMLSPPSSRDTGMGRGLCQTPALSYTDSVAVWSCYCRWDHPTSPSSSPLCFSFEYSGELSQKYIQATVFLGSPCLVSKSFMT